MRILIAFLLLVSATQGTYAEVIEVTLLHTNDIESVYEPIQAEWRDDIEKIGGLPYLASLIREVRADTGVSFLMDAGDIFTGALSKKTHGELPFDLYSAMEYDVITLGNHEFEYGWTTLVETMPRARFPVLNANIVHKDSETRIAQPYTILERGGVRIGVVGVMGVDAFHNTTATFQRAELTVIDPLTTAQYWVDKIHDDVDMVVLLTHQNRTAPMQTNKESDPSVQRGFHEDYAMAGAIRDVDVIFGGHSDNGLMEPFVHPESGTVIGLTFGQGMHLGYMRFAVDTISNQVELLEGKLIPVDAGSLPRDQRTHKLISMARQSHPELAEPVAQLSQAAMRRYNRESTIGNLLTDVMRSAAESDVAMLNSGGIRADFNPGTITREHLLNVYPFADNLTVVKLSGKQLRELVAYSLTLPYGIGQFSGLEISYDGSKPEAQRLISVTSGGKPLADNKTYSVATTNFLSNGGDGYRVFTEGEVMTADLPMVQVLLDGFSKMEVVELPQLDRQIDVSLLD